MDQIEESDTSPLMNDLTEPKRTATLPSLGFVFDNSRIAYTVCYHLAVTRSEVICGREEMW